MPGTSAILKSPLLIIIVAVGLANVAKPAPCSSQGPASYDLIFEEDAMTEETGSLTLKCRDEYAEVVKINEVGFFLNRSSATDPSLREREDISVIEVGNIGIRFNLTRRLEGNYTCGRRVNCTDMTESPPRTLISLQTIVPLLPLPQTNFTATSGERVTLHCPIQPGALLQQYTVRWKKDETTIAELTNSMRVVTIDDSRYQIDRATYSLIIDPVNISDTNSNYQCEIFVTNPQSLTPTRRMLQPSPSVTLSLKVNTATGDGDEDKTTDFTGSTTEAWPTTEEPTDNPLVNFWCACQPRKPPAL